MASLTTTSGQEHQTASSIQTFLVVDDSPIDAAIAGKLLSQHGRARVVYAENGVKALEIVKNLRPDLVLTDLNMPEMDGLELVESIRRLYPSVPVMLMTAHGSEEIALQALRRGAASYVPKRTLATELVETVRQIVELSWAGEQQRRIFGSWQRLGIEFRLENDSGLIPPLVSHLQQYHSGNPVYDETESIRVGVALQECFATPCTMETSSSTLTCVDRTQRRIIELQRNGSDSPLMSVAVFCSRLTSRLKNRDS